MQIRILGKKNKGYGFERTKTVNPIYPSENKEKIFSKNWRKLNKGQRGINYGFGILQDLMIEQPVRPIEPARMITKITKRDRFIVATVIQWLGTNCGFSFLNDCLRDSGYRIVKNGE